MALVTSAGSTNGALQNTIATATITAPAQNQIVVVAVTQGGNGNGTVTNSNSLIAVPGASLLTSTTNGYFMSVFYKVAGASEPTSYTLTSNGNNWMASQIFVFSGRNTSTPITAAAGTTGPAASGSALSLALTGITTAASDDVIWCGSTSRPQTVTFTAPSSPATFGNSLLTQFTTSGNTASIGSAVNQNFGGGATGTVTGTISWTGGGNNDWLGYLISIAAAAANPPTATIAWLT